jgi:hypothetical protein
VPTQQPPQPHHQLTPSAPNYFQQSFPSAPQHQPQPEPQRHVAQPVAVEESLIDL